MAEDPIRIGFNSEQEQKLTPLTFNELTTKLLHRRPQLLTAKQKEAGLPLKTFHSFGTALDEGKWRVFLVAAFDPPLFGGRRNDTRYQYWGIDNTKTVQVDIDREGKLMEDKPHGFIVCDVSLTDLQNNNFTDEIQEIDPSKVLVAGDKGTADETGSWIMDPIVRARVEENAGNIRLFEKYLWLRRAATETTSVPGFGRFTYQDVAKKANSDLPFPIFSLDDLEWLQNLMKNKGIPIPNV